MGYRHYIGYIKDSDLEKIDSMGIKDTWELFDKLKNKTTCLHELGKLMFVKQEIYDTIYKKCESLLPEEKYPDEEYFICDQNILLDVANIYRKITSDYYKKLYKKVKDEKGEDFKAGIGELIMNCGNKAITVGGEFKKDGNMEINWDYEYQMFQLFYLYKTFRKKGRTLVVYAW